MFRGLIIVPWSPLMDGCQRATGRRQGMGILLVSGSRVGIDCYSGPLMAQWSRRRAGVRQAYSLGGPACDVVLQDRVQSGGLLVRYWDIYCGFWDTG